MSSPSLKSGLWFEPNYRRLWFALLFSSFAGQIAGLTLSLTAATVLHATPAQIGMLGAMGTLPFAVFMLPAGVWLDRVRKLPAFVAGEIVMAVMFATVPVALVLDRLAIELLYLVAFAGACVSVVSGTAGQVVLTLVVRRDQLIEAHGQNRLAGSFAEIAGPGLAGLLVKLAGSALTLLLSCGLMVWSALLLRGLRVSEPLAPGSGRNFWSELAAGFRFVVDDRLLRTMALTVGLWQIFQTCAMVTQVLFATRELELNSLEFGLCLAGAGVGTVLAARYGHRLSARIGPGPTMIGGFALSGLGWLQLAWAPAGNVGVAALLVMLLCFGSSVVLIFSNLLALRQAITPAPMLARMTSTMRWITLFPALPGNLLGGLLAEHFGLRLPLLVGGAGSLGLAILLWRFSVLRSVKAIGQADNSSPGH